MDYSYGGQVKQGGLKNVQGLFTPHSMAALTELGVDCSVHGPLCIGLARSGEHRERSAADRRAAAFEKTRFCLL